MHSNYRGIITLLFIITSFFSYSQDDSENLEDNSTPANSLFKQEFNTWSVGAGVSNLILHGDLKSFGTRSGDNYYNFGGYVYVDKMFNPILGVQLKFDYHTIGGEKITLTDAQEYNILYAGNYQRDLVFVEGNSIAGEASIIVNLDNLWKRHSQKWSFAMYASMGYQIYNSRLILKDFENFDPVRKQEGFDRGALEADGTIKAADFGFNSFRDRTNYATSIFFGVGAGVKYKLSKRFDLEMRSSIYKNNEDHLDAAISRKQNNELYFVTNLGVNFKLGKKEKEYAIWVQDTPDFDPFTLVDTDNDGTPDELDKEPDTPEGAQVYGNGVAIDSDKDGIQDYKDDCPLEPGLIANQGCPVKLEAVDIGADLNIAPEIQEVPVVEIAEEDKKTIRDKIALLARQIFFLSNKDVIKQKSYSKLNEIAAVMHEFPQSKFKIEGHTDSRGRDAYNLDLSKRRAKAVLDYLTNKDIASDRLSSKGFGEVQPIATNDTEEGRQQNRRVEINFIDPDSPEGKLVYDSGVDFTVVGTKGTGAGANLTGLNVSKVVALTSDQDQDGVPDLYDIEANTPRESKVYGNGVSVDSDGDDVPDYKDNCPFVVGSVESSGCPDNGQNKPDQPLGNAKDADGDGVPDYLDKEANTPAGVQVYSNGVSYDADNDGVPDYKDKCPLQAGGNANDGCPIGPNDDSDGDGVADAKDFCPETKGPISNNGCPDQKTDSSIERQLNQLAERIQFGRAEGHILKSSNLAILGQIGDVMNKYKATTFKILVHTGTKPNLKYNLDLSKRRAFAIKKYLTKAKGISSDRIEVEGVGAKDLKYSPDTSESNARNNRIEIKYN